MATKGKDDGERNKRIVGELVKLAENQLCADCGAKGPRWASANLGLFMCIRCSGIHRNLGVHISFVRSVSLDEWKASQVETMVRWGNKRANEFWEAGVPADYYIPDENDSVQLVERWIRDKYEKGRFKAKTRPKCADTDVDLSAPLSTVMALARGEAKASKAKAEKSAAAAGGGGAAAPAAAPAATLSMKTPGAGAAAAAAAPAAKAAPAPAAAAAAASNDLLDLMGFDAFPPVTAAPSAAAAAPAAGGGSKAASDIMSLYGGGAAPAGGMMQQQQPFQPQFPQQQQQQQQFALAQQFGAMGMGGGMQQQQQQPAAFNPFAGGAGMGMGGMPAAFPGGAAALPQQQHLPTAAAKPPAAKDPFDAFASF